MTSVASDRVYALRGDRWVRLPPLKHARGAAAAAVVGDRIVVVGGQADGKLVPQTEVFDGQRWTDAARMPTPREHLGAASDGRYLYAVGGRELSAAENVGALERYDPANDSWSKLAAMPKVVGSVGVTFVAGRVIAVGGEGITTRRTSCRAMTCAVMPGRSSPRCRRHVTGPRWRRSGVRSTRSGARRRPDTSSRRKTSTCWTSADGGRCPDRWLRVPADRAGHHRCVVGLGRSLGSSEWSGTAASAGARNCTTVSPKRRTSPSFSALWSVTRSPFR